MSKTRAKQAILYVCRKLSDEKSFGSTVLNKVLYYIDHANYLHTGKTITGMGYIRQVNGPTPNPGEFLALKREMMANHELREEETEFFGRLQKRCVPIHHPNLTCFTPDEVALMDTIIDNFVGVTAKNASDLSHQELSWKLARNMEELPPYAFLLSEATLNNEDIAWGKKIIASYSRT